MQPQQREDLLYSQGKDNKIEIEEKVLLERLGKESKGEVLDIGCGVGGVTTAIQEMGHQVRGVDFSQVGVEKAREKGIKAECSDVDKDGLIFPDNEFDYVWMTDVLEHVFDPINLVLEISRVLRPGGKVYITVPNDITLYRRVMILLRGYSPHSSIYRRDGICKHHTLFAWELLEFMLTSAGLEEIYVGSFLFFPRTKLRKYSTSKVLGKLFGKNFVVIATKNE